MEPVGPGQERAAVEVCLQAPGVNEIQTLQPQAPRPPSGGVRFVGPMEAVRTTAPLPPTWVRRCYEQALHSTKRVWRSAFGAAPTERPVAAKRSAGWSGPSPYASWPEAVFARGIAFHRAPGTRAGTTHGRTAFRERRQRTAVTQRSAATWTQSGRRVDNRSCDALRKTNAEVGLKKTISSETPEERVAAEGCVKSANVETQRL